MRVRELQQLVGKLNWTARVNRGGHTFLQCLIDLMNILKCSSHSTYLNSTACTDIKWWALFNQIFNGSTYFVDANPLL